MAKSSRKTIKKSDHEGHVRKWDGPSPYGSHSCMVVASDGWFADTLSEEEVQQIAETFGFVTAGRVVCKDEKGFYLTYKSRLDSGLADPRRYNGR